MLPKLTCSHHEVALIQSWTGLNALRFWSLVGRIRSDGSLLTSWLRATEEISGICESSLHKVMHYTYSADSRTTGCLNLNWTTWGNHNTFYQYFYSIFNQLLDTILCQDLHYFLTVSFLDWKANAFAFLMCVKIFLIVLFYPGRWGSLVDPVAGLR